jgi:hypothetical protein
MRSGLATGEFDAVRVRGGGWLVGAVMSQTLADRYYMSQKPFLCHSHTVTPFTTRSVTLCEFS